MSVTVNILISTMGEKYRLERPKHSELKPTFGHREGEKGLERKTISGHISTFLSGENWDQFKDQLIALFIDCFPDYGIEPQLIEEMFTKMFPDDIVALLQDKESLKLIGFSVAHIYTQQSDTANISMTGVAKEKRGQKLVGELLAGLDEELKRRGVKFITRQSRINDGYADAIERHYGERIIEKKDHTEGTKDPKRYFKISL